MKKILATMLLLMVGFVGKSQAALIQKSISSTTFVSGFAASDVLLLNPRESLNYTLTGGATGTIHLERSVDGSNYTVLLSTTNNPTTGRLSGTQFSGEQTSFYRWRASTMTGAGSFNVALEDNDDFVGEIRNNKKVPSITFTDERVYVPKLRFEPTGETAIVVRSTDTLLPSNFPKSYAIITATGSAMVMTSVPTISTAAAVLGDIYIIQSTTATITVQDDGTLAGSALELGAATRALGVGDILGLIYRGGKWWELFFANN